MAAQRESNELVFRLCMRVEVIIPVHGFSVVAIFLQLREKHRKIW